MILYLGPVERLDGEQEEVMESMLLDWYHAHRDALGLIGIYPYDPILREFAIDIGRQRTDEVVESLEAWMRRFDSEVGRINIGTCSIVEELAPTQRGDHVRRKMLYLLDSLRQLNDGLQSAKVRQIEYLLAGIATEVVDIMQAEPTASSQDGGPTRLEESLSRQMDEFWNRL